MEFNLCELCFSDSVDLTIDRFRRASRSIPYMEYGRLMEELGVGYLLSNLYPRLATLSKVIPDAVPINIPRVRGVDYDPLLPMAIPMRRVALTDGIGDRLYLWVTSSPNRYRMGLCNARKQCTVEYITFDSDLRILEQSMWFVSRGNTTNVLGGDLLYSSIGPAIAPTKLNTDRWIDVDGVSASHLTRNTLINLDENHAPKRIYLPLNRDDVHTTTTRKWRL